MVAKSRFFSLIFLQGHTRPAVPLPPRMAQFLGEMARILVPSLTVLAAVAVLARFFGASTSVRSGTGNQADFPVFQNLL